MNLSPTHRKQTPPVSHHRKYHFYGPLRTLKLSFPDAPLPPSPRPPTFAFCSLVKKIRGELTDLDGLRTLSSTGERLRLPWKPEPPNSVTDRVRALLQKQGYPWAWLETGFCCCWLYFHCFPCFIFEKHGGCIHSPRIQENFWFCFWPLLAKA